MKKLLIVAGILIMIFLAAESSKADEWDSVSITGIDERSAQLEVEGSDASGNYDPESVTRSSPEGFVIEYDAFFSWPDGNPPPTTVGVVRMAMVGYPEVAEVPIAGVVFVETPPGSDIYKGTYTTTHYDGTGTWIVEIEFQINDHTFPADNEYYATVKGTFIPEPTTIISLLLGGLGLAVRKRFKFWG